MRKIYLTTDFSGRGGGGRAAKPMATVQRGGGGGDVDSRTVRPSTASIPWLDELLDTVMSKTVRIAKNVIGDLERSSSNRKHLPTAFLDPSSSVQITPT